MLDGTNPEDDIDGTIDPPNPDDESRASLSSADEETFDPGTIDPPNNN